MKMFLEVVAAWIGLDVALIATWHLARVRIRRFGAHVASSGFTTQRAYLVAPDARLREKVPKLVHAGRG